jgi:hypothetical protein
MPTCTIIPLRWTDDANPPPGAPFGVIGDSAFETLMDNAAAVQVNAPGSATYTTHYLYRSKVNAGNGTQRWLIVGYAVFTNRRSSSKGEERDLFEGGVTDLTTTIVIQPNIGIPTPIPATTKLAHHP